MSLIVSLGTARNHLCSREPCRICHPEPLRRARSYRCTGCDVYGRGISCWSCGSTDLLWGTPVQ